MTTIDVTPEIDAIAETLRQLGARIRQQPAGTEPDRQAVRHLTAFARQSTRIAAKAVQAGDTEAAARMRDLAAQCTDLAAEVRQRAHLQIVPG